jgi:hypothetical protein
MPTFVNKMREKFGSEVDEANAKAFEALGYDDPLAPGPFGANSDNDGRNWSATPGFTNFVRKGTKFKWVLIWRGPGKPAELNVISSILKHSVAAGGGDVYTAGSGYYRSSDNTMVIDNDTGHYQTTVKSLDLAVPAWVGLGYNVQTKERVDFTKLF